jgi:acyl-CoA thioesterase
MTERPDDRVRGRSLFAIDTAVEAVDDRRFAATVTSHWDGLAGRPLGGYVLAACLRAMKQTLPFADLLVVSAFFLNPVEPGPVEIQVEIARAGRRSATAEATLSQQGVEALRSVATFTNLDDVKGQNLVVGSPPHLPAPEEAVDLHQGSPHPTASIADRVEYRIGDGFEPRTFTATDGHRTTLWMRLKEGGNQDLLSLPFLVDAAPPVVMELGATGSTTVQLTAHVRARPASDWLACQATTRYITDGYHDEDFEIWDEHGRLVAQSRQLARLPSSDILAPTDESLEGTVHDNALAPKARIGAAVGASAKTGG